MAEASTVRGLALGWSLWLLGAWAVTLAIDSTVPAVRWMVYAALMGLMLIWPMLRLSQRGTAALAGTLLDWVCLMLVFQAVIWPLRLSGDWTMPQTWWLNATMGAWSLLTGLVIAWGRRVDRGSIRTLAMVACVGLLLGEPALRASTGIVSGDLWLSPLGLVWQLTESPTHYVAQRWAMPVGSAGAAALVGWGLLGWWARSHLRDVLR